MSRWNELCALGEMVIDTELLKANENSSVNEIYEKVKHAYNLYGVSKASIKEYIEDKLSDMGNW